MTPKVWRLLAVSCTSVILVFVVCFMGPRFLAESGGVFGQKEVVVRASPRAPPKPQNRLLPDAEEIDRWIKLRDMGSSAAEEEAKEKEALKQAVLQKEKQRAARGEVLIYFGGGCFWHMQHAFVQAERKYLSRKDDELTSVAGYAGAKRTGPQGRVCYHNEWARDSDYGRLGYAEAVQVELPTARMGEFAGTFFERFRGGVRHDPQDVGGEYRSVLGLPGGFSSPLLAAFEAPARRAGMTLVQGKGSDTDTLGAKTVLVYDSAVFPFHQAEVYHQFHDDMTVRYGAAYNDLRKLALADGRLQETTCPNQPD